MRGADEMDGMDEMDGVGEGGAGEGGAGEGGNGSRRAWGGEAFRLAETLARKGDHFRRCVRAPGLKPHLAKQLQMPPGSAKRRRERSALRSAARSARQ